MNRSPGHTLARMSPRITDMIRMDHTHVFAVFHRFKADTSPARKSALVRNACLALEVHAQLEEEIFYPALRAIGADADVLDKSVPEHDEMRGLISRLRALSPEDAGFDDTFHALQRAVVHHVADEESVLLPLAERTLAPRLSELGAQMTRRRMQLIAPHARELAATSAQSFPLAAIVAGMMGLWLVMRALGGMKPPPARRAGLLPALRPRRS
jgi:hypothetical protein